MDPGAVADLQAPPEGVTVHLVPPVPQREAIGYMLGADLLLLEEFGWVMPSKALQYLRAARPLLALLDVGRRDPRSPRGTCLRPISLDRGDAARVGALIAALAAGPRRRRAIPTPRWRSTRGARSPGATPPSSTAYASALRRRDRTVTSARSRSGAGAASPPSRRARRGRR